VKVKLLKEEYDDIPIKELMEQYQKKQINQPFRHNGKKYAMIGYVVKIEKDGTEYAEVKLREIK